MRIFFGKIKASSDNRQIKETCYETLSPMKLGELQPGDYAFIINGKNVHLWKAKERIDIEGNARMNFDVILEKLPVSTQKFAALKFFKLESNLIVLSIRRSPKAFYQIGLTTPLLTEEMLCDISTYENEDNYRKIKVLSTPVNIDDTSVDIQLFFKPDGSLNILHAPFIESSMYNDFVDNLSKIGNGRKFKDKALKKIKEGTNRNLTYTYDELPILRLYDAVFNEYGSPDEPDEISTNEQQLEKIDPQSPLELTSHNHIFFGPPGTGKTYQVRQNFCMEEDVVSEEKETPTRLYADRTFWHMAPGQNGYLWDKLKSGNVLGYEWVEKDWNDIRKLTRKEIEEVGWGNLQLITYIKEVKAGDYICVISGRKFLGIAEVISPYSYPESLDNDYNFQTLPVKWLKKFEPPLLLNSSMTKTFVRMNYGTRWSTLLDQLRANGFYFDDTEIVENKISSPRNYTFVTFHQSFSYEDFMEGIKPVLPETENDNPGNIQYQIEQGIFYQVCEKAAQLAGYIDLQDCLSQTKRHRKRELNKDGLLEYYLIIDELNRGNIASIFGELITLIESDKRLGANSEITTILPYSKTPFGVPANLRIIGTMNTADRSIQQLDTALRRRFTFEEILPDPSLLKPFKTGEIEIDLSKLLTTINKRLEKLIDRDHTIGHSFLLKVDDTKQLRYAFGNKIIPLLQDYFYSNYAKIGLVIGADFLAISNEKTVFMKVRNFSSEGLEDKVVYSLQDISKMTDETFINAIRAIYE